MKKYYLIYFGTIASLYSMEDVNNNNIQNVPIRKNKEEYTFNIYFKEYESNIYKQVFFPNYSLHKKKQEQKCKVNINPKFFKKRIKHFQKLLMEQPHLFSANLRPLWSETIKNALNPEKIADFQKKIEKTCEELNVAINDRENPTDLINIANYIPNIAKMKNPSSPSNIQRVLNVFAIYTFLDCIVKINPYDGSITDPRLIYGPGLIACGGNVKCLEIFYKISSTMPLDNSRQRIHHYIPREHTKTKYFLISIPYPKVPESLQQIDIKNLTHQLNKQPDAAQPWLENTPTIPEE